jgi:hypothetical protein
MHTIIHEVRATLSGLLARLNHEVMSAELRQALRALPGELRRRLGRDAAVHDSVDERDPLDEALARFELLVDQFCALEEPEVHRELEKASMQLNGALARVSRLMMPVRASKGFGIVET